MTRGTLEQTEHDIIETAVVIPVHNRKAMTLSCLKDLHSQTYRGFITILVDDGSADGTSDAVREFFPNVIIIRGNGQLWWTGAMNSGLEYALSNFPALKYVVALNDDLNFDVDLLESLVGEGRRLHPALVGSVVVDCKGSILEGGFTVNWVTARWRQLHVGESLSNFDRDHMEKASTLTGRGVLIPVDALRQHGIYNRKHYMQCGDTELPCRLAKRGYPLYVSYKCRVVNADLSAGESTRKYQLSDLGNYLFDIKSNMNLRYRFWFAWDSTPPRAKATYLLFDLGRILVHFWKQLR